MVAKIPTLTLQDHGHCWDWSVTHTYSIVLCEYSKFRIKVTSVFDSIRNERNYLKYTKEFKRMGSCISFKSLCWPIMAHQVLKILQQKPQQCGAIKTVEFI